MNFFAYSAWVALFVRCCTNIFDEHEKVTVVCRGGYKSEVPVERRWRSISGTARNRNFTRHHRSREVELSRAMDLIAPNKPSLLKSQTVSSDEHFGAPFSESVLGSTPSGGNTLN